MKILHVMRAPVGGLFRHVVDLARGQAERGHEVGIVADAATGGERAERAFAQIAAACALGVTRVPMSRHLGISDITARGAVARLVQSRQVDVVHGHGAKGGAYARLTGRPGAIRVYTPHGGSLHYSRRSPVGLLYLTLERVLMPRTELFLFESAYGRDRFRASIGAPANLVQVVHNGVAEEEFAPAAADPDAADFVFVGELRQLKGADVLIDAVALLARDRRVTATIVGDGPDAAAFRARAEARQVASLVTFPGAMPARAAFRRGRVLVVPSRAESLPYIVLEAGAAAMPMLATRVGGIPEILGPDAERLIPPGDPAALADAMRSVLKEPAAAAAQAARLQARIRASFSVATMTEQVLAAYARAFR